MNCKHYADNIIEDCKKYPGRPIGASCIGCKEQCIHATAILSRKICGRRLMNRNKDE